MSHPSTELPHHAVAAHADPAFPKLHPRPDQGWLNDPNGIAYWDGRYHVFFQYNPESARHAAITWGHVSSNDLVHWRDDGVALRPQPSGPDSFGCWSGVMADDDGMPTAVYSAVRGDSGRSVVALARGSADLRMWRQDGETAAQMPDDPEVTALRDPFLFSFQGRRYAIQGAGLADGRGALLLYDADRLTAWKYLGIWLTTDEPIAALHAPANIWECPQLVEVDGNWVLILSLWSRGPHGHALGGVAHLIGRMEERDGRPVYVPESGGDTDAGPDFYAPQILALPDRALLWGWSWESRSQEESDQAGWAGLLTFPRELALVQGRLTVSPARELSGLRQRELPTGSRTELPSVAEAVLEAHPSAAVELVLESAQGSTSVFAGPVGNGLRILLDASIVEIYRTGLTALTRRVYPATGEQWILRVSGSAEIRAWELGL